MAETVVVQPANQSDNSAVVMILGIIVIVALVIGGVYIYRHNGVRAASPATNINVTLPVGGGTGAANQ
jgi:hypothetical protein